MRPWQSVLQRDSAAWEDFLSWLNELETAQLREFLNKTIDAPTQRGVVQGIGLVRQRAKLNMLEEASIARSAAAR
jgi:hypothetical protein